MQSLTKVVNSSLSASLPTSRPGSELLVNICRALLYTVVMELPGVTGVRGV